MVSDGFSVSSSSWGYPNSSLDGVFHGQSENKMDDDWGYPYDSGNPPNPSIFPVNTGNMLGWHEKSP